MSHSSRTYLRTPSDTVSSVNFDQRISGSSVTSAPPVIAPGSYADAANIRRTLFQSMKRSGKSRAAIAEQMSYLIGTTVTETMLSRFTADSRSDCRSPAEYDRAFCAATGDTTLLVERARMAGLIIIDENQAHLLEIGRAYVEQRRANEAMQRLEREITGGAA